ncbi:MAG: hypothetical protein RBR20_10980 [Desulfobacterales bacterium]|jgi:PIN domain nuclease of toxin-antitoxin system|nr:hypothetical protein [Desulfobacteraceae bacterium]MDY0312636.1 hypothetical protein [Desulfobacterales bacterium]
MKLLLGTHILLWAAGCPEKLSPSARSLLTASENALFFSRLLLAQAGAEGMSLVTADASVVRYEKAVLAV